MVLTEPFTAESAKPLTAPAALLESVTQVHFPFNAIDQPADARIGFLELLPFFPG